MNKVLSEKTIICVVVFATIFLCVGLQKASAFGSPDYLPDGPHPRMFLSGSILTELAAKKDTNTAEWTALKNWCDAHLGENATAGYQGTEWAKFGTNYALCYRMTNDNSYGAEALIYLNAMLNNDTSNGAIGSTGGFSGANAIQSDSGYIARVIGFSVPVVRDWLDGYAGLDSTVIALCNQRLNEWITWYATSGYQRDYPRDNYYSGYFQMMFAAAYGLYGDSGYQNAWMTKTNSMWNDEIIPLLEGRFNGASNQEGWSYGAHSAEAFLQYPYVAQQAAGDSRKWNDTDWYVDVAKGMIHQLHPNRSTMADDGIWDSNKFGWPDTLTLMDSIAAHAPISQTLAENARWYVANLTQPRNLRSLWAAFLFYEPSGEASIPTEASIGSLSWQTSGEFFSRSAEWSNQNATWWSVTAWQGDNNEGARNVGEFKVMSRSEQLLVDGSPSTYEGYTTNTLSATGPHRYAPWQDWENDSVNIVSAAGNGYTVARVNDIEQAYDTEYYGATLAHYHRNILNIGADLFVVSDSAIPLAASTMARRWHFLGSPITTTNTIRSNHTGGDLSVWSDGVVATPIERVGYPYRTGSYAVDVSGAGITVFEAGDPGFVPKSISQITGTGGNGVVVGGVAVAMFTANPSGANMSSLSYSVSTLDSSSHYISDLNPDQSYSVSIDGQQSVQYTANDAGVINFENTSSGLHSYVITAGAADIIAPGSPTNLAVL